MSDQPHGSGDGAAPPADRARDGFVEVARVTPLELFFDLVFVFALTQVTALMAADPTWLGLLRGMAVLTVLWWAWVAYVWIGTTTDAEDGVARFVLLVAMGAMFVTALAAPEAFGRYGVLFGVAYFVVRLLHVVMFRVVGRRQPDVGAAVARLAPGLLLGSALIVVAGFLPAGWPRGVLWATAVLIDVGSPLVTGTRGWHVSPRHFAERHGLVIIIALGESLVAVGLGVAGVELGPRIVTAVLLGFVAVACLWWLYFDVVAIAAERRFVTAAVEDRNDIARDSYNYFHLPMVAGVVLLALGLKKVYADLDSPLKLTVSVALLGGAALYLLGHLLFRRRNMRSWNVQRAVAMVVLLALVPVGVLAPAWVSLVCLTATLVALVAYESLHFAAGRRALRTGHATAG
ncbi:MAG: low temperature requirement protein A [Frankiales bacterium]|nr:low temperature requirement protein A [Frankiales bacterium]